ncbi:MAG: glycosyltransferase [Gemmatimonadetes bacterium]|nr:glycosyltransferase [Gemmatimonadota bacterium]
MQRESPIKVVWLIHNRRASGPYPKIVEQLRALAGIGIEGSLLCTSPASRFRLTESVEEGVPVIECPDLLWGALRQGADLWNTLRRIGWLRGHVPDVIHAIDARPAVILPALYAQRRLGAALVLSWWDLFGEGGVTTDRSGPLYAGTIGRIEGAFETMFRGQADAATAISDPLYRRLAARGFPPERMEVIRLGSDTSRFAIGEKRVSRARLGWDPERTVVCYVGNLLPADRVLLFEAARLVRRAIDPASLRLVWIGGPPADLVPHEAGIEVLPRADPSRLYEMLVASDLCLLPLRRSAGNSARWPSKVADYLNAGRPVVCTPVSDVAEIVSRRDLGVVSAGDEPEPYARALLEALDRRSEWSRWGAGSRAYAEEQLDVRALAARLATLYECARRHRASVLGNT